MDFCLKVIFDILWLPLAIFAFVFALTAVHLLVIWDFAIDLEKPLKCRHRQTDRQTDGQT